MKGSGWTIICTVKASIYGKMVDRTKENISRGRNMVLAFTNTATDMSI